LGSVDGCNVWVYRLRKGQKIAVTTWVGKPFGREPLLTLRMIWEDSNKLHLKKISCRGWEMEVSASGSFPIVSFCTRDVEGLTMAVLSLWTCQDTLVIYYFIPE
jgi:hypothetical protein